MKDDFVSNVSHELKSPLAAIETYLNLLLSNPTELTEKNKEYLIKIKNNVTRLAHFIDDVLEISKIERGALILKREKIQITPIIYEVVDFYKPLAAQKRIKINTNLKHNDTLIFADYDKVRQILINLLSNAIKFTKADGTITISSSLDSNFVKLCIEDTGIGIPKEEQSKIFDKFYQAEKLKGTKGTGLGLTIVKELVKQHNGDIWVESEPGKGSKFYFSLPIATI